MTKNEAEVVENLAGLGFSTKLKEWIGCKYRFRAVKDGDVLIGTILGIEISSLDGLNIYVSNPFFTGLRVHSISLRPDKITWFVALERESLEAEKGDYECLDGAFTLL